MADGPIFVDPVPRPGSWAREVMDRNAAEARVVQAAVAWYEVVEDIKKTGRSARINEMKETLDKLHADITKLKAGENNASE